jgi:hypothetical protein
VKVLRWLLLFPAVIAVPAVVAALGNAIATFAAAGCPADRLAAGVCVAASHVAVLDWLIYGGVALAAVAAVLVGALIAPGRKFIGGALAFALICLPLAAAWFAMGAGGQFALGNTRGQILQLLLIAVAAGAVVLVWVRTWRSAAR